MSIGIRFAGLNEARRTVELLPEHVERTALLGLSQLAYDEAQRGAGRHNKTGALFRSLYNRAIPKGREVGHDPDAAPHAAFVQFGTRPHLIAPKDKKALRWASGGEFVFARIVNHPGYVGDPYMIRAADVAVAGLPAIMNQTMKEAP